MKVTAIKNQVKDKSRYSVFVDNKYAFSLSERALMDSKLANGDELDNSKVNRLKELSGDDKLYNRALKLVASRSKTEGEMRDYLRRKDASPALVDTILNKLSDIDLINDEKYARSFVNDRLLLRPTSRRKIIAELKKKHIKQSTIDSALTDYSGDPHALNEVIRQKRRQEKYKDNLKLMQYLARQGFNYDDIRSALSGLEE
jgi:regulatory protein